VDLTEDDIQRDPSSFVNGMMRVYTNIKYMPKKFQAQVQDDQIN